MLVLTKPVKDLTPRKIKAVVDLCDICVTFVLKQRKEKHKDRKKRWAALTDNEMIVGGSGIMNNE